MAPHAKIAMNRNLPSMPSRILLSDDDSVLLAGLAEQLAHEGLHVVVCASSA